MLAEACLGRLAGRGAGTLRVDDAMVGFGEHPLLSSLGPGDPVGPDPMLLEASLRPPTPLVSVLPALMGHDVGPTRLIRSLMQDLISSPDPEQHVTTSRGLSMIPHHAAHSDTDPASVAVLGSLTDDDSLLARDLASSGPISSVCPSSQPMVFEPSQAEDVEPQATGTSGPSLESIRFQLSDDPLTPLGSPSSRRHVTLSRGSLDPLFRCIFLKELALR